MALQMMLFKSLLLRAISVVAIGGSVAACSDSGPSCSSDGERELVLQIIKDHRNEIPVANGVTQAVFLQLSNMANAPDPKLEQLQAEYDEVYQTFLRETDQSKVDELKQLVQTKREELNSYSSERAKKFKPKPFDEYVSEVSFTLDNIRLKSRDATTHAVLCQATLTASLPMSDEKRDQEIAYQVEVNSEGQYYATVQTQ